MKVNYIFALLMYIPLSYADIDQVQDKIIEFNRGIDACLNEYQIIKGDLAATSEINKAYIHEYKNNFGYSVYFTRGERGTFGKTAINYELILACTITADDGIVKSMHEPDNDKPLIEKISFEDIPYTTDSDVIEHLFELNNNQFKYCCSQVLDMMKRIYENNPGRSEDPVLLR